MRRRRAEPMGPMAKALWVGVVYVAFLVLMIHAEQTAKREESPTPPAAKATPAG